MKHRFKFGIVWMATVVSCLLINVNKTDADVTVYTDATAFANALMANDYPSQSVNFDSIVAGSIFAPPSTLGAITFDNFGPPDLIVTNQFATTSGSNYLGMSDIGFADQFVGGFEVDFQFANSRAIGFFIITGEIAGLSIFDNDILLEVPGSGTAALDVDDLQFVIGGTDSVYFVGLIDTMQTFPAARLSYDAAAISAIVFNIDDMVTAIDPLLGDVNRDGIVNLLDVDPFIDRLATGVFQIEADINQDGLVNLLDVDPFIELLSGG